MYIPLWLISLVLAIALSWFLMARVDSPNFRYYLYKEEREKDIFAKLRREYEFNNIIMKKYWPNWGGDEKPIYKEVIKYAKTKNIYDKLIEWMDKDNSLCDPCHWFKSKIDVDIWFHDNLKVSLEIHTE